MKRLLLVLLLLPLLVLPGRAVSQWVDNSYGGTSTGTISQPWKTLATVNQAALSGDDKVWIKYTGTAYNEKVTMAKSGTSGHRITWAGYGGTPVLRGVDGVNFNYIGLHNLEITHLSTANSYPGIRWAGVTGWLLQDVNVHHTYKDGLLCETGTVNSFNIIRNVAFDEICSIGNGVWGQPAFTIVGHYNLVEYISVNHGLDRCRFYGTGNVLRNYYFGYTDPANYPAIGGSTTHLDGLQSYDGSLALVSMLIDRGWDSDNDDTYLDQGTANGHNVFIRDTTNSRNFRNLLIRQSVFIRTSESCLTTQVVDVVRSYNITLINPAYRKTGTNNPPIGFITDGTGTLSDDYDFRNYTVYAAARSTSSHGIWYDADRPTNFRTAANHVFNPVGPQSVLPTGAFPANLSQVDPLFIDGTGAPGHDNYNLQSGSPLRAAGAAMTTASGSGSNSISLTVVDATTLFDGRGIADADWIKIGSGGTLVQIDSISGDTVTLKAARSWINGDGVWVEGTQDLGALPYDASGYALSGTYTNSGNVYTFTYTGAGRPRMVIPKEDGIPQAPIYAAPYTYTSNGGVVTFDIFSLYARVTSVVAATVASDVTAPTPNPSTIAGTPVVHSSTSFSVTATTATDAGSPPVLYRFSSNGGSSWTAYQSSATYTFTGLTASTTYQVQVQAEDSAGTPNVTTASGSTAVTTDASAGASVPVRSRRGGVRLN